MHLYSSIIGIDPGSLLEDLQRPESVVGYEVKFGVVSHCAVRIQLAGDSDGVACALQRRGVSSRRTALKTLRDPGSAERKIIPAGPETGSQLRDPLKDRHEIRVRKLCFPKPDAASEVKPERRLGEGGAAALRVRQAESRPGSGGGDVSLEIGCSGVGNAPVLRPQGRAAVFVGERQAGVHRGP